MTLWMPATDGRFGFNTSPPIPPTPRSAPRSPRACWPTGIRRRSPARVADKRLLQAWIRAVRPPESHHWEIRMADNWLAEPATD